MFTLVSQNSRMSVSAVAAVAIVSLHALALDQGYIAAAPKGTVEIGALTPVYTAHNPVATLPEVVVSAKRYDAHKARFAALPSLPEITVTAQRSSGQLVKMDAADAARTLQKAGAKAASVLLK